MVDTLLLTTRSSVPPEIAYLRARFPVDGWRAHPNYGQLTAFWLHVHANLRTGGAQLQQALDAFRMDPSDSRGFGRRFAPGLAGFHQRLDAHHRIEDQAYFPKFRAIDPRMAIAFDMLESDHAIIHGAIERSLQSARRLLGSLDAGLDAIRFAADDHAHDAGRLMALLARHLGDEEEIVVPAMLEFGERPVA